MRHHIRFPLTGREAFYAVLGPDLVFLHIDLRRNSRPDLQMLAISAMIIALMVGCTLKVLRKR